MMDLIDDPALGANSPEFTVSEISGAVKRLIEGDFSHVRIRGEIGRVSMPRSGHVYLDLKDDRAVLAGVIWKGVAQRLPVRPEEGMEVVATGRLTTFPGQSKYQMVIEDIAPAGAGALMAMLEQRKKALAAEGLFDPARKQQLPFLPEVIGVVTSPSGAVIRDILHRLRERFPRKVLIWPVAVQGEKCAPEVARAIAGFNAMTPGGALPRPDLIIVARGGGSVEDLWGFNDEAVVRAAANSQIPLISAVGHETDTTLIDFASDKRAPTPTAAAEMAVPVRLELAGFLDTLGGRMARAAGLGVTSRQQRLRDLSRALPRPSALTEGPAQRLDLLGTRLPQALTQGVQRRRVALSTASGSLRPAALKRLVDHARQRLAALGPRLDPSLRRAAERKGAALEKIAARLSPRPIRTDIRHQHSRIDALSRRLSDAGLRQTKTWRDKIDTLDRVRETLGYEKTLQRGFAVLRDSDGGVLTTAKATETASAKGPVEAQLADGRVILGGGAAARPKPKPAKTPPPDQGSLF